MNENCKPKLNMYITKPQEDLQHITSKKEMNNCAGTGWKT